MIEQLIAPIALSLLCTICLRYTLHKWRGAQHLPNGDLDLYDCQECKNTQSVKK